MRRLKVGTVLVREYQGERHTVTVVGDGYVWRDATYASLSTIARAITGTAWSGPRFFGVRAVRQADRRTCVVRTQEPWRCRQNLIVATPRRLRSAQR